MDNHLLFAIGVLFFSFFVFYITANVRFKKNSNLNGQAILKFYGDHLQINGCSVQKENITIGTNGEKIITLYPGLHFIHATFLINQNSTNPEVTEEYSFPITLEHDQFYQLTVQETPSSKNKVVFLMPLSPEKILQKKQYLICEKV